MCEAVQHHWTFMLDHLELHTVPDAANPPRAGIEHDVIGVEGEAAAGEGEAELPPHRASGVTGRGNPCRARRGYPPHTGTGNKASRSNGRSRAAQTGGSRRSPLGSHAQTDDSREKPLTFPASSPTQSGSRFSPLLQVYNHAHSFIPHTPIGQCPLHVNLISRVVIGLAFSARERARWISVQRASKSSYCAVIGQCQCWARVREFECAVIGQHCQSGARESLLEESSSQLTVSERAEGSRLLRDSPKAI